MIYKINCIHFYFISQPTLGLTSLSKHTFALFFNLTKKGGYYGRKRSR